MTEPFSQKGWLDSHVIPWLQPTRLTLYSVLWNGHPPVDVLVFLLAGREIPPPVGADNDNENVADADEEESDWAQVARAAQAATNAARADTAGLACVDPAAWPVAVKQLLDAGFRFDFLRDVQMVPSEAGMIPIFGGDGAPQLAKNHIVSVRLWRKIEAVNLIVQVGAQYPSALDATAAIKAFFGLFDQNPVQVCQTFGAPFGAA